MHVVMIELDIMVDKRGPLELWVLLDRIERDRVFEDCGIEVVGAGKGKTIQADRNDGGDGSHVQEGFGRRLKMRGLIYPGNDPNWVMPNWFRWAAGMGEAAVGRREVTAVERSGLRCSS